MAIQAKCSKCGEDFLIITKEIEAYKEKDLPLPTMCPTHRMERRMSLRNKKELFGYNCDKCGKDIITAVEPEDGLKIYCKTCYQAYMQENDCILGYSEGYKARTGGGGGEQPTTQGSQPPLTDENNSVEDPVSW